MTVKPTFRWTCSYMGCIWFAVYDETGHYEAVLRRELGDYERSIAAPSAIPDMEAAVGLLVRNSFPSRGIPSATVDAFNAWRLAEHAKTLAALRAQPHRYGEIPDDDPIAQPPAIARAGGRYEAGAGWIADR